MLTYICQSQKQMPVMTVRVAQLVAPLQPGCEKMEGEGENEEEMERE